MLKLAADENFNNELVRGLRRRLPSVDIIRIQDEECLVGRPDPEVLDWCCSQGRLLLTHDARTMPDFLAQRMAQGKFGVGVLLIRAPYSQRQIIDDLVIVVDCSDLSEWVDRCSYLPLR